MIATTLTSGRRRDCLGGILKLKYLTPSYRMLILFAYSNLEPEGCMSEVIMEIGFLLYVIGTGQPIDLPLMIFNHMLNALDGAKTTSLPYGVLISRIRFTHGVAVGPQDSIVRGRGTVLIALLVYLPLMSNLMTSMQKMKMRL